MTDERQNPDSSSEEDWAMAEVKKPQAAAPVPDPDAEVAARLYDPLDTGDLEGWEIPSEPSDVTIEFPVSSEAPEAAPVETPRPFSPSPTGQPFEAPRHTYEVLKPIRPAQNADDWTMSAPPDSGWTMPDPVFVASAGRVYGKKAAGASPTEPPAPAEEEQIEALSDLYEPPNTGELEEPVPDEFEPAVHDQFVVEIPDDPPPAAQETPDAHIARRGRRGRIWMIGFGLIAAVIVIGLAAVAFGLYYFSYR